MLLWMHRAPVHRACLSVLMAINYGMDARISSIVQNQACLQRAGPADSAEDPDRLQVDPEFRIAGYGRSGYVGLGAL